MSELTEQQRKRKIVSKLKSEPDWEPGFIPGVWRHRPTNERVDLDQGIQDEQGNVHPVWWFMERDGIGVPPF